LIGRLTRDKFADGVFDDVADDVFWRVVDAACLANLGLGLDANAFIRGDSNVAEEAFIDRSEDVDRDSVEVVRRIDVREAFAERVLTNHR
jgi:hypothetical protein